MDEWAQKILEPIQLGSLLLRNRVALPGHTTNFAHANRPTERYASYLAERSIGGVGLIITEGIRVHPTSAGRHISLGSFGDESIDDYEVVVKAVKAHGAAIFAQLLHAGRQANGDATRTAAWAPSPVAWSPGAYQPHAMGLGEIRTIVTAFGQAARRMQLSGFDGIELHLGHGHLLQQFLSPATNHREDHYGGSLENRLRFAREVLEAISQAAPGMPTGYRVSANEFLPGGLEPVNVIEIVNELSMTVKPTYINVSHSAYHASWSLATQMADMAFPHAAFKNHAVLFTAGCPGIPILAVCRLDSLQEAAELVSEGEADLVGLVRPHIADPHLVNKAHAGNADARGLSSQRSCLACNQACIARVEQSLAMSCVVNPEVGFEAEWTDTRRHLQLTPRAAPKVRVLVVGGGPAGMAAASAADAVGHYVTLMDSGPQLGGQFIRAASLPGRERLGLLTIDAERELRASRVRIVLETTADESTFVNGDWDDIIIATGSTPAQRFDGVGMLALDCWSAADVAAGKKELQAGAIVVVDDEGTITGSNLVEALAKLGRTVHIVSSSAGLASRVTTYSRLALVKRFVDLGVQVHLLSSIDRVGDEEVTLVGPYSSESLTIHDVAAVVDVGSAHANDALFRALDARPNGSTVHIVGDANSPRTAFEAVFEGRMAGTFRGDLSTPSARRIASTA